MKSGNKMSQDHTIDIIESCYRQIASDGAALRRWQKQYIAHLDAAHAAELAEMTARYAAQRRTVETQRQTQHATADAVLAQENAAIYSLWQQAAAAPKWAG